MALENTLCSEYRSLHGTGTASRSSNAAYGIQSGMYLMEAEACLFCKKHCLCPVLFAPKARILVTRQPMFSAVRQIVARSFLPHSAGIEPPDGYLPKVCTEAASGNVQLTNRLFEIVSSGSSVFGMIDYHTAFNAAIILELGCLCRQGEILTGEGPQIGHVLDVLQRAGLHGNEFARDCSTVLADFRQLRERLMQEMLRRIPANISLPLPSSSQISGTLPPDASEIPGPMVMGFALEDCLSPGLEFDRVLEEFNNWLEEAPF